LNRYPREKIFASCDKEFKIFNQINAAKISENIVWIRKNLLRIPDQEPEVKKAPNLISGSRNTGYGPEQWYALRSLAKDTVRDSQGYLATL
jgi:hypothetical protein